MQKERSKRKCNKIDFLVQIFLHWFDSNRIECIVLTHTVNSKFPRTERGKKRKTDNKYDPLRKWRTYTLNLFPKYKNKQQVFTSYCDFH